MIDRYYKLIKLQQETQSNKSSVLINIHLAVRGAMHSYCVELNEQLSKVAKSKISFNEKSFCIPHMTLAMGYVKSQTDLQEINKRLTYFTKRLKAFAINPTQPFLLEHRNDYIFINAQEERKILLLKQKLYSEIKDILIPLSWDVTAAEPHITIGYINKKPKEVRAFLAKAKKPPTWQAEAIEISYCGLLGTCLGSIKSFELK